MESAWFGEKPNEVAASVPARLTHPDRVDMLLIMETLPAKRRIQVVTDLYIAEVHAGILAYSRKANWFLQDALCYSPSLRKSFNRPTDGILATVTMPELQGWLQEQTVPVVRTLNAGQHLPFPAVEQDPQAIGAGAASHLLTLGQPHFVYYSCRRSIETDACWKGFSEQLRAAGKTATRLDFESTIRQSSFNMAPDVCWTWLQDELARLSRPIALLAEDDRFLVDVFQAIGMLGWRVPEDIAVMGQDNRPLVLAKLPGSVTSIDTGLWQVGYEAAALLDRILDGEPPPTNPLRVPPGPVVARRSTEVYFDEHSGVSSAITHLRQNFKRPLTLESLARQTGVSSRTLQKHFKPATGRSFKEELIRLRLDHVTHLLSDTDLKLESVAHEAGFASAKYLCDAFRKSFGTSPVAYRRTLSTSR